MTGRGWTCTAWASGPLATRAAFAHRRFSPPSLCLFLGLLARKITAIRPRLGDLRQGVAFSKKKKGKPGSGRNLDIKGSPVTTASAGNSHTPHPPVFL